MSREKPAPELRPQFSLRAILVLTVAVAFAAASWHYLRELAVLGLPLWSGLVGAVVSNRRRWAFAWMFIVWFWCGFVVLLLILCLEPSFHFVFPLNEAM